MPASLRHPKDLKCLCVIFTRRQRKLREVTMSAQQSKMHDILIAVIADLLDGCRHVAVGASSPIPAAGAMLLRAKAEGRETVRISILGSEAHNFFTNGG